MTRFTRGASTVAQLPAPPADQPADLAPDGTSLAAAVVLVLSATTVVFAHLDSRPGTDYQLHTLLFLSDLALLVLTLVVARRLPSAMRAWRSHGCALAGLVLGMSMVPGLLAHPSDRGGAALLRWAGASALGLAIGSARADGRRLVVAALASVSLANVVVALAERAKDGPVGLGSLGEPSAYAIGGRYASTGLTVHPYVLAAWCAVTGTSLLVIGGRRVPGRLATVAGITAFVGIGLTMSRAGALAVVLALGALAVAALLFDRGSLGRLVAAVAAFGVGVLLDFSGWASRAGTTSSSDAVTSGRGALLHQAGPLLRDNLLTGVGPGRYVLALTERPNLVALSPQSPRPVHLTPLLLLVEGGIVVAPALLLLALAIGRACRRGGAPAVAVTLAMLPFLALDHLTWSYPQGIVLAGVWLGVLDMLAQRGEEPPPRHEEAAPPEAG